jgi:type II secretory pathway component GspD/PulD (secretin)
MTRRIAALALLGGLLAIHPGGQAQDDKKSTTTRLKPYRATYAVKNGDAAGLADVLSKHFSGQADVLSAGAGNVLLISATSEVTTQEVVKLLAELDRKPRMIEVEVTIAEVPARKGDGKDKPVAAAEVDLTGVDVLTKLDAMKKAGQLGPMQRIKLTAVEGQPITSTNGGNKPYATSSQVAGAGGRGLAQRSINYQAVGTTIRMTARVGAGDAIAVDLNLQDSQVKQPEAEEENSAPTFDNNTLNTKLSIPPGKPVVAQAVRADGKTGRTVALVVVTARVADVAGAGNNQ